MITREQIEKILDRNIREIPYEGTEVNKYSIIDSILELVNQPSENAEDSCDGNCKCKDCKQAYKKATLGW